MKKLLVLFLSCLLLVGCSQGTSGKTAVCTMDLSDSGMTGSMEVTFKAEKDVVSSMTMNVKMDVSEYDQSMQELMKQALDDELIGEYSGDGVTANSELKDGNYSIVIDITDMEKAANVFGGGSSDFTNAKLEDVVAEAEKSGATCK